jgi:hypothetical protein
LTNLADISRNILTILLDRKLVLNVYFQKIYSLSKLLLVLFSILEKIYNNSGGAKFTAGSIDPKISKLDRAIICRPVYVLIFRMNNA